MFKFFLYIFLGYLLFRFIVGFLIPAFKAGRQIKKQFSQMQQQMQEQMRQQEPAYQREPSRQPQQTKPSNGEYIDFEEVK